MKNALGPGRYGAFVGIMGIALLVVVTISTFSSDGRGARGLRAGDRLPPFVAVLATADRDCDDDSDPCDANVARRPDSGNAGARPACTLRGPDLMNLCALQERGPVVVAFLATRGGDCESDLDILKGVQRRHPGVSVAAIGIKGSRGDLRDVIRDRRWTFPVGWDRDGAVTNLYGVAVCPQFIFARWRGTVVSSAFGAISAAELERRVRQLETLSRRVGWKPPAA